MIDINSLITNKTNLIEIYFCPNQKYNDKNINIELDDNFLTKIKNNFKITKNYKYATYYHNNISYTYDRSDDNQFINSIKIENDKYYNNKKIDLYILYLNESKLPNYYFPCIIDIDNKEEYDIIEFKINNRISLLIKNNNCYIQYRYNKNLEIDKMQFLLNNIIKKILSFL
jgi:hypothetical protein